jgi:hypothetical protein
MPEHSLVPVERIERVILVQRRHKVSLDKNLAALYGVTTGNLNKVVARNTERFPDDFMFQLSPDEMENLIFHSGTSSWGGTRKPPRAFTEQGVAMLSSVLRSQRAVQVNLNSAPFVWMLLVTASPRGLQQHVRAVKIEVAALAGA